MWQSNASLWIVLLLIISHLIVVQGGWRWLGASVAKVHHVSSWSKLATSSAAAVLLSCAIPLSSVALTAENSITTSTTIQKVIYKSGKSPIGLPSSKTDSKKDISFLRCMSNCKTSCQRPGEGLARVDCVQDCQDQCCTSYEQCSFKINSNGLGNGI